MEKKKKTETGTSLRSVISLSPEEKRNKIIELRQQGYTYREIARMLRVSLRDISRALKDKEEDNDVFLVFRELEKGRGLTEIVVKHRISPERVENIAKQYAALKKIDINLAAELEERVKRLESLVSSAFEVTTCRECGFHTPCPEDLR